MLSGAQRDRQADFFGSVANRATIDLIMPDGLLDVDKRGFHWSPVGGDRVRDLGASWGEISSVEVAPIEGKRHALTIHLDDASRLGLITDNNPAKIPGFSELLSAAGDST